MWLETFKLIKKTALTKDVFEMVFELPHDFLVKPWQFITFILPSLWWRSYSIVEKDNNKIKILIKRYEEGRWWSKFICDLREWLFLEGVWPSGSFTLKESKKNKLFLWTWTGLSPLYNQINWAIRQGIDYKLKLIFGLRYEEDLFYIDKLSEIKENNNNFDFEVYVSREEVEWCKKWYVTDFLTEENVKEFWEFYICGMPNMIDSCVERLKKLGVSNDDIVMERY